MDDNLNEYIQSLPYHLEAEQSVLGSVLIDPELLTEIMNKIKSPTVFYTTQHQEIFALMIKMFSESKPIDFVTFLD
ncbi:MAG: DnaB-like helicase N-terminal domain-containing protein, partial [Oscillospiraceae bacterium]